MSTAPMRKYLLYCLWAALLPGLFSCQRGKQERGPPACVVDIDGTVTDPRYLRRTEKKVPILEARDVLRWLESQGVAVIYLSSRPVERLGKTSAWLKKYDFPPGEEICLRPDLQEEKEIFKTHVLKELEKRYTILFGLGNAPTDAEAYQKCGVTPIMIGEDPGHGWSHARQVMQETLEKRKARPPR